MAVRSLRSIVRSLAAMEELVEDALIDAIGDDPIILHSAKSRMRWLRNAFQADLRVMECDHDFRRVATSGPRDNGDTCDDICIRCRYVK